MTRHTHLKELRETLSLIFSDAVLLDLDLSAWTSELTLAVLADHYGDGPRGGSAPVVVLTFSGVERFSLDFRQHASEPTRLVWRLTNPTVEIDQDRLELDLDSSFEHAPRLQMSATDVTISSVEHWQVRMAIPEWDPSPGRSGFIRAGLRARLFGTDG